MTPPSATTSCRWRHTNTSWNHGYKGIAENGRASSYLVPMILQWPPKKKDPKCRRGQEFRVHTYPTVSSRPRGKTCAKFGSDRFRNVNMYKFHTYKQTNIIFIYKIVRKAKFWIWSGLRSRDIHNNFVSLIQCVFLQLIH